MNYYVNLYFLPECMQSPSPEADNIAMGYLCRSSIEAADEAISRQLFGGENNDWMYVGTLNDPHTTDFIISCISEIEKNIMDMKRDFMPIPDNLRDFEERYRAHKDEKTANYPPERKYL